MCGAGLRGRAWGGAVGDGVRQSGAGQRAWVVLTGGCGCLRGVELLGAGLAALIWILVRIDILTVRGQVGCFTGLSTAVDSQTLTLP